MCKKGGSRKATNSYIVRHSSSVDRANRSDKLMEGLPKESAEAKSLRRNTRSLQRQVALTLTTLDPAP